MLGEVFFYLHTDLSIEKEAQNLMASLSLSSPYGQLPISAFFFMLYIMI
jgi:hypothetical protein